MKLKISHRSGASPVANFWIESASTISFHQYIHIYVYVYALAINKLYIEPVNWTFNLNEFQHKKITERHKCYGCFIEIQSGNLFFALKEQAKHATTKHTFNLMQFQNCHKMVCIHWIETHEWREALICIDGFFFSFIQLSTLIVVATSFGWLKMREENEFLKLALVLAAASTSFCTSSQWVQL